MFALREMLVLKWWEKEEVKDLLGAACDRFLRTEDDALTVLNNVAAVLDVNLRIYIYMVKDSQIVSSRTITKQEMTWNENIEMRRSSRSGLQERIGCPFEHRVYLSA